MKVIYHRADLDGIGSAAVVYNYYLEHNPNDMPKFIGYDYKDNSDKIIDQIEHNESVWFVDCCFEPVSQLIKVENKTKTIHLLDHHGSSISEYKRLEKECNLYCFDVDEENAKINAHSAIYLVWKKLYPEKNLPTVVDYVSKYDSWNHEGNQDILDFYMGLNHHIYNPTYGYKNELWRILFDDNPHRVASITADGKIIREYLERQSYAFCLEGLIEIEIDGHKGIALNTPYRGSQNIQGVDKTKFDFTMGFVNLGDSWRYSVYSENKVFDVSKIAKKFDGGGHKGAAGFQSVTLIDEIINGKKYKN